MSDIHFHKASFLQSAPGLPQCPPDYGAEVAFAGRSNAGKSSVINALTANRKLARTSKTPGRTQLLNFFALGDEYRLVDLPGYGFAKVAKSQRAEWQRQLDRYLRARRSLAGIILVSDIRHPLQNFDTAMLDWCQQAGLPVHVLLSKADKLSHGAAKACLIKVQKALSANEQASVQLFSAHKKSGLEELGAVVSNWLVQAAIKTPAPAGEPGAGEV